MSNLEQSVHTITAILAAREQLALVLGDEWPAFETSLLAVLAELAEAVEADVEQLTTDLLALAWHTPAFPIFRRIMQQTQTESGLTEVSRRHGDPFTVRSGESLSRLTQDEFSVGVRQAIALWKKETPHRIVSTGFAAVDQPGTPVQLTMPLAIDRPYYFWFEVGQKVIGSIEQTDEELPLGELPPRAILDVVLFGFTGELQLTEGADIGRLQVTRQGEVRVHQPAAQPADLLGNEVLARRLFFPVHTPAQPGSYRLRCHVYHQNTLVQSRLITVQVTAEPVAQGTPALVSVMDYSLSKTFNGRQLQGMGQTRLSLLVNHNGNGTHGFRFFGRQEAERPFTHDATINAGAIQDLITTMRQVLHKASWGDNEPYQRGKQYRYEGPLNVARLHQDLVSFALKGYRFYDVLIGRLAGNEPRAQELQTLMRQPGQVQIALKEFVQLVPPAAMIYDYPLYDNLKTSAYTLCPAFLKSLSEPMPLAETACFQGNCPSRGEKAVVCPSGFWGYRHSLGLPVSVSTAPDAPAVIPSSAVPQLAVGVSTDEAFVRRRAHEQALQQMGVGWEYADSLGTAVTMLKNTKSQVVYFYCHGGYQADAHLPYLVLGPVDGDRFTRALLRTEEIFWQAPRPLVFINGCHTTALEPEKALDLVSGFVETAQAAGVIGTEITIFEPVAVAFAEACLRRFLLQEQTIGEAVRGARLEMLQAGNPLGLVYIPYVMPGLHVVKN